MSKSALNDLCLRCKWTSPVYLTTKTGPAHIPSFSATVTVNGATFASESTANSSKEAQNQAARVALLRLAARAQAPPPPSPGIPHIYKNNLQIYAQRRNLSLPVYAPERHGPFHACQFRCSVTVGGQTYSNEELFSTLKDAENSAAKVALEVLQAGGSREEGLMYKNLLYERIKKEGELPFYETMMLGNAHAPTFVSRVHVKGHIFAGQEAKTKKLAEMSAAKVAYTLLIEGGTEPSVIQPVPKIDSVVVNPPASFPVGPTASPTTFPVQALPVGSMSTYTPTNEGTSTSARRFFQTNTRQPNRIVFHGSDILELIDGIWVPVKSYPQAPSM